MPIGNEFPQFLFIWGCLNFSFILKDFFFLPNIEFLIGCTFLMLSNAILHGLKGRIKCQSNGAFDDFLFWLL
jgi:hypothetical protein